MSWREPKEPFFEVRRSRIQGRGAFALRRIRKGTRVIEYTGERISEAEGDRRYDDDHMGRHHTFLFSLDDGTVVDGAVGGNDSRYINHSCDPNCETLIEDGQIFVQALRTIEPDDELHYDYAYERTSLHTAADELLYACRCGAERCRGSILAPLKTRARKKRRIAAKKRGATGKRAAAKKRGAKRGRAGGGSTR